MIDNMHEKMFTKFSKLETPENGKYSIAQHGDSVYIGKTPENKPAVIWLNDTNGQNRKLSYGRLKLRLAQKIQLLTSEIECLGADNKVNLLQFESTMLDEIKMFFETVNNLLIEAYGDNVSQNDLIHTLSGLSQMITNKKKHDQKSIQGQFAELCVIKHLFESHKMDYAIYYHHSFDDKFDFSITEVDKLEVKSTLSEHRIHEFSHTQLTYPSRNIKVASVLMRKDDRGTSLPELSEELKEVFNHPEHQVFHRTLDAFLECCEDDDLNEQFYSMTYIMENIKYFNAKDIPQFDTTEPQGVTNTRYKVDMNFAKTIEPI